MNLNLLPALTLLAAFLVLYGRRSAASPAGVSARASSGSISSRETLLYATVGWGAYLALASELLGLARALTRTALVLVWALPLAGLLVWGWRSGALRAAWLALINMRAGWRLTGVERGLLIALGVLAVLLLAVAWVSPINNNDSLQYHLPRVAHWAQNHSLAHYPTAYEWQLFNAIWAELVLLQAFILGGGDQALGLLQWGAWLGLALLASLTARELGGGKRAQLLAGIFIAALPMAVLQATSTQNDLVSACWNLALAFFAVRSARRGLTLTEAALLGGALGLGMLTKLTFYLYALPFLVWAFAALLRRAGFKRALLAALLAGGIAVALNTPFWLRNLDTFGSPVGMRQGVEYHLLDDLAPRTIAVNLMQNLSLQMALPWDAANGVMTAGITRACQALGGQACAQVRDYPFRVGPFSNHEDTAGSPWHLALALAAGGLALFGGRRADLASRRLLALYGGVTALSLLMFAATIAWQPFSARYQVNFFALVAPLLGAAFAAYAPRWVYPLAVVLLLAALPYALFNRTRPVIGLMPRTTLTRSVFVESKPNLMLVHNEVFNDAVVQVSKALLGTGCKTVGLKLDSKDPEYALWSFIEPWKRGMRLEVINPSPELARLADPAFQPCAVVCTLCGEKPVEAGLPLVFRDHGLSLYLSPDYRLADTPQTAD